MASAAALGVAGSTGLAFYGWTAMAFGSLSLDMFRMEGDESFLGMLNFGVSTQVPDSPVGEQESPMLPTQKTSTTVKGKSTKGKNWSIEEDDLLVAAWVHTNLDALIETDQTSNSYWGRIYDYYSTRKKVSWPVRVQNALNCRWTTINEQVSKFCGYYQQILNRNQSGVTIAQQQAQALVLYQSKDPKKRPFTLMHCWLVLEKHPKWENRVISKGPQKKQKKTSDASPGTTSNDEDFERCTDALETETRPDGNKREKTHLQKAKASASDAFSPKLSLENVWAQKLKKAEVKVTKTGRCHTSNLS
ncbi:glutathione S-transferase T3-like [Triticum dicoccoides]|uniref:glutathione S-transferase T3-like n=1 Tax=Triticum dicoccoides TaxID=85692 RepID=UPI00188E9F1A|nr:glutathione S-transferase T3-like [Triticum dicoccoides]XP_037432941.1 glutathione S-transferase T3-like [Triticum dicoccoides]